MIQTMKRSLAMLLALVMLVAFVPVLLVNTSAEQVNYVYSNQGYIYNWGTRGTTATFLSPNAEAFYQDNNTSYDELAAYSGGTGTSDAPTSALYNALKTLMVSNHSYINAYSANNDLLKYTDCQNGGGQISSFYSGTAIGPGWGEGGSWNKEHTWPNSKGLGGSDEDDIMMIRPTATSENSSRGNKAYGQSSGYYNPNSESGGKYDLRGDVARIFLYVYVRWGNVNGNGQYSTWGTSGVMESLDVLLEWMEADPVDTWELGRNDSVESITGTRNVFVDYPELAFLLFGAEVPENMTTPSGEAAGSSSKCDHNNFDAGVIVVATCTDKGYTIYTCQTANCGYSYKTDVVAATGHNYVSGACSACGEAEPNVPKYVTSVVPGTAYKLGLFSTEKNAEQYFSGTMTGYYGTTDTNYNNGVDVFVETTNGGYYIYFMNSSNQKQYINLVVSGTYRNFTFASTASTVYTWDSEKNAMKTTLESEVCYIGTYGSYYTMGVLQSSKLKDTDYIARFYTMDGGSQDTPDTPDTPSCTHNYNAVVTAPTCTAGGFTTYTCTLCNHSYTGNQTSATGHSYVDGTCSKCGATQPTGTTATITFGADKANRVTFTTSQQVWKQNGITVTNDKASATSDVADYSNPARFYQGSNVTIEFPGMTKVEIDCTDLDTKYVDSWLNVTGATATKNGGIVTIVFDSPVNSLTYTGLAKQSRAYSITVYAEGQSEPSIPDTPACQHTNTTLVGAVAATCTTDGHTGATVCQDCNVTINAGSTIPASGHNYVNDTCSKCGATKPSGTEATITFDSAKANRVTFTTSQQVWKQNGITVTNDKGSSTSNIGDYSAPARFYQGSNVTIEFPGMTKIVINCTGVNANDKDYAAPWLNVTGATATNDNGIVTIVLNAPADSFTITGFTSQARALSITVYADGQSEPSNPDEPACKHANTAVVGAIAATCTTDGHTGATVCQDCNVTINAGSVIPASGHSYVNGTCSNCGEAAPECKHTSTAVVGAIAATCTTEGYTGNTVCQECGVTVSEGSAVPATGHTLANWRQINAPTCTKAGLERRDCGSCTYYEKQEIPALGHTDADADEICDVCEADLHVEEDITTPEDPEDNTPEDNTPDAPEQTTPDEDDQVTEDEEHVCKEISGFQAFINSIINFFRKLFGMPELCPCGEVVLEKKD